MPCGRVAHPDEYRAALLELTELDPDLAPTVNIPMWFRGGRPGSLRSLGAKMASDGLVKQEPDAAAAIYTES